MKGKPLSNFEAFVLALITEGHRTPYELQQAAGLSIGASVPALRRLSNSKLVKSGKAGPRGRKDFSVTPLGARILSQHLKTLGDVIPADFETLIRNVALLLKDGQKPAALRQLRDYRPKSFETNRKSKSSPERLDLAGLHAWMFGQRAQIRAQADAKVAQALLRRLSSGPRTSQKPR